MQSLYVDASYRLILMGIPLPTYLPTYLPTSANICQHEYYPLLLPISSFFTGGYLMASPYWKLPQNSDVSPCFWNKIHRKKSYEIFLTLKTSMTPLPGGHFSAPRPVPREGCGTAMWQARLPPSDCTAAWSGVDCCERGGRHSNNHGNLTYPWNISWKWFWKLSHQKM